MALTVYFEYQVYQFTIGGLYFYLSGKSAFISGDHRDVLVVDRERVDHVTEIRVTFARATSYTWWWSSANTTPYYVTVSKVTVTSAEDGRRYNIK